MHVQRLHAHQQKFVRRRWALRCEANELWRIDVFHVQWSRKMTTKANFARGDFSATEIDWDDRYLSMIVYWHYSNLIHSVFYQWEKDSYDKFWYFNKFKAHWKCSCADCSSFESSSIDGEGEIDLEIKKNMSIKILFIDPINLSP